MDVRRLMWSQFNILSNPFGNIDDDELDAILRKVQVMFGGEMSESVTYSERDFIRKESDIYRDAFYRLCGSGR